MDINCEDMEDGTCRVTYCPTEPGNYTFNIKFAEKHIPGKIETNEQLKQTWALCGPWAKCGPLAASDRPVNSTPF